jgi:hypothetical protein
VGEGNQSIESYVFPKPAPEGQRRDIDFIAASLSIKAVIKIFDAFGAWVLIVTPFIPSPLRGEQK